jgi:hypothetical protein
MPTDQDAYTAILETETCARCHEGETWTVKGPDGLCIGQSWAGDEAECNALETAEMLNGAYRLGRESAAAPDLLASLKEMGDWIAAGLQASGEAWPDAKCLQHTEEIAARARAAVDKAEGRPSTGSCEKCGGSGRLTIYDIPTYVGQSCSPIGDEPCPKCSPDGNAT